MLNSLEIKNFRLLESFQVKKLGRVNLIVGKNNSGKSTVLEAIRIYAGNANRFLLNTIATEHNEKYQIDEENPFNGILPFEDLFTGRQFPNDDKSIKIGEIGAAAKNLSIKHAYLTEKEEVKDSGTSEEKTSRFTKIVITVSEFSALDYEAKIEHILLVEKNEQQFTHELEKPFYSLTRAYMETRSIVPCNVIPTQFVSMEQLAKEWDSIVLTDGEKIVKQALRIVLPEFENLTFIEGPKSDGSSQRLAKVKIANLSRPVSLNSLGDGMVRILQLVLKVFSAKDGFLLIDEFENGLHYSVQEKVWALLFQLSKDLNIQIFATTHSWDCIESFSKVAVANQDVEGVLFRVGKSIKKSEKDRVIATVFDEEQLYNITQSDVEVR